MKIHGIDEYKNLIFDSPEITSAYFRSIYDDNRGKKSEDKKKKISKQLTNLEYLYHSLPMSKQFVVNNLILDLLSESKSKGYVGVYLEEFLHADNITHSELALYIYGYLMVSITVQESQDSDIIELREKNLGDIKSSIQKMTRTVNTNSNSLILKLIADYFCVSPNVLIMGKGKRYCIDFIHLKNIVDKNGVNVEEFLKQHLEMDMNEDASKNNKSAFEQYLHHSVRTFAEIVAEQFAIDTNEILIEEECWVELDEYPFYKYYHLLTEANKKIIKHVIENLSIEDITG